MSLLEVKNLRIEYPSRHGVHAAVKSLSSILNEVKLLVWSVNLALGNQP